MTSGIHTVLHELFLVEWRGGWGYMHRLDSFIGLFFFKQLIHFSQVSFFHISYGDKVIK